MLTHICTLTVPSTALFIELKSNIREEELCTKKIKQGSDAARTSFFEMFALKAGRPIGQYEVPLSQEPEVVLLDPHDIAFVKEYMPHDPTIVRVLDLIEPTDATDTEEEAESPSA